jgi:hypothetical protein
MQQTTAVNFPLTEEEVEIMLAITFFSRGLRRGLARLCISLGHQLKRAQNENHTAQ